MYPVFWVLSGVASVIGYKYLVGKDIVREDRMNEELRKNREEIAALNERVKHAEELNRKAAEIIGKYYKPEDE